MITTQMGGKARIGRMFCLMKFETGDIMLISQEDNVCCIFSTKKNNNNIYACIVAKKHCEPYEKFWHI